MLRRVTLVTSCLPSLFSRYSSVSNPPPLESQLPIEGAHGKDNKAGVYSVPTPKPYFEVDMLNPKPQAKGKHEPIDRSDNIKCPEYDLIHGQFENVPPHLSGGPPAMRFNKYAKAEGKETVEFNDVYPQPPHVGHHELFDYLNRSGKKEGNISNMANTVANWDLKLALFSLYRCCLRGIPMIKHYYYITMPIDQMYQKIRHRFEMNKNVRDPDAIRHLLHNGWTEYQDTMTFRRTRDSLLRYFDQHEGREHFRNVYSEEEGQLLEEKKFWNGEEQRKEGPYDGHWSWMGKKTEEEFIKLAGRIPKSWSTTKGYFEIHSPDGTNYWEKNLDYEGWYVKNVDPDKDNARREAQGWIESGYNQPKHYASKNRRAYRRFVKDIEMLMESSFEEIYSRNRELYFQMNMRQIYPESNRVFSEKKLAMKDDEVYSTNWVEIEKHLKQAMREMPNPRMWRTDAFYLRYKYLSADLEYNWALVPVGREQEKLYNDWISDDINYAILNSKMFASIKKDKKRNPMAGTWAEFYRNFDPDDESTRKLPWYHPDFNYDRRYKWDEHCMRKKKWIDSGDIDGKNTFFDSFIVEWEQHINRSDLLREENQVDRRYLAPRMVQLYRALNVLMDVALVNQMRLLLGKDLVNLNIENMSSFIEKKDFKDFKFNVPILIYPDGAPQLLCGLDGTPS